jgi:hypothetical protein
MAMQESSSLDLLGTVALGFGELGAQHEVLDDAVLVSQALRGAETRAARAWRRARELDPERLAVLEEDLRAASAEVSRVATAKLEERDHELEARLRARNEALNRAVHEKERVQRALAALAAEAGQRDISKSTIADLAAALPERHAAAAIVGYTHCEPNPKRAGHGPSKEWLIAFVIRREGELVLRPLAPRQDVELRLAELRVQVGAGAVRSERPAISAGQVPHEQTGTNSQQAIRRAVLDPILAELSEDTTTLYLAVDEALELVPLDALAQDDGSPIGEKIALKPLGSLFELLEQNLVEP